MGVMMLGGFDSWFISLSCRNGELYKVIKFKEILAMKKKSEIIDLMCHDYGDLRGPPKQHLQQEPS